MSMATSPLEHLSADRNPYGCPFGVWWLMHPGTSDPLLRAINRLGPARVQWARPIRLSPAYNSDDAWLLDGKPVTIGKLFFLGGGDR